MERQRVSGINRKPGLKVRRIKLRKGGKTRPVRKFIAFVLLLLPLLCFYPYEIITVYPFLFPSGSIAWIAVSFVFLVATFLLFRAKKPRPFPQQVYMLVGVQLVGYALCFFVQGKTGAFFYQLLLTAQFLAFLFCINSTIGFVAFFKKYQYWLLIMAAMGALAWGLTEFVGFRPLYFVQDQTDQNRDIYNYLLTFSVHDADHTAMRYAGFFDEPGAMANWGLFALLINKLFINDKRIEIPLIICLLFTLSMGFYAQMILYFLFFYTKKANRGTGILVIAAVAAFFLVMVKIGDSGEGGVYDKTIGRIERIISESKEDKGVASVDSRDGNSAVALYEFIHNPLFGTKNTEDYIGDNIFEPLAMYGIVGTLFIYFPFFWLFALARKRKDKDMMKVMIIIFVGFLHRPFHRTLLWSVILFGMTIMYLQLRGRRRRFVLKNMPR